MYAAKTYQATRNHDLCGHENKPPHALHIISSAVPLPALFQEHYFISVQPLNLLLNSESHHPEHKELTARVASEA